MASKSNFRPSHDNRHSRMARGPLAGHLGSPRRQRARDRPIILLELLSGTHEDPAADTAAICESFGRDAFIVQRGGKDCSVARDCCPRQEYKLGNRHRVAERTILARGIQRDEFALRQA